MRTRAKGKGGNEPRDASIVQRVVRLHRRRTKFTCERWADHPGPHAIGEHAAILDYDDALRMRLVLATERQAKALEAIAAILDDVCNGDGYVRTVVVE